MEQVVTDYNFARGAPERESLFRRVTRKRQNVRILLYAMLAVCDVVAIRTGYVIAASIRGPAWLTPEGFDIGWAIVALHGFIGLFVEAYSYQALQSRLESVRRGSHAFLFATALMCMLLVFQHLAQEISRIAFGTATVLSLLFLALFRILLSTVLVRRGDNGMIGTLLIVDDSPIPSGYAGATLDCRAMGIVPDIYNPAQLAGLAERIAPYDRVVVACTGAERRRDWARVLKCYQLTCELVLDISNPLGAIGMDRFYGQDTVVVSRGSLSLGRRIQKRAMDVAISLLAIVCLSPLLILVAILVAVDSRGPILFAQPRVGRDNRMFRILKFRSMRHEKRDINGARSTMRDDDRITRVGRIIRATSIDELPQLFNVLLGDMSIVGPRPHALGSLAGDKLFWEIDTQYWHRHVVKPGITGLAQIRGFRGATHLETDLEKRLQSDLEYVAGWSLWRDIKILISTVRVLIHPQAY